MVGYFKTYLQTVYGRVLCDVFFKLFLYSEVLYDIFSDCSFMVGYFVVSRPFFDMGDVRMNAMTQSDRMEVNTTTKHPMDFMSFMRA